VLLSKNNTRIIPLYITALNLIIEASSGQLET